MSNFTFLGSLKERNFHCKPPHAWSNRDHCAFCQLSRKASCGRKGILGIRDFGTRENRAFQKLLTARRLLVLGSWSAKRWLVHGSRNARWLLGFGRLHVRRWMSSRPWRDRWSLVLKKKSCELVLKWKTDLERKRPKIDLSFFCKLSQMAPATKTVAKTEKK